MSLVPALLTRLSLALLVSVLALPAHAGELCKIDDVTFDWSDAENPNGVWSYREGENPLPFVDAWERNQGHWATSQPGWARSEEANTRLPFWFRSNGTENFVRDWQAGDVVVHSVDAANGVGAAPAELVWTSPSEGIVSVMGSVWMGREIGRANLWQIFLNDELLTSGNISSGDAFSRADPFRFAEGSDSANVLRSIAVSEGDELRLVVTTTTTSGDFVGVDLAIGCELPLCGDPTAAFQAINTTDALFVLRTAVGLFDCDLCVCDVNDSGSVTAPDALRVLQSAVGQPARLVCPDCSLAAS
jgi:hypothetical protein